MQEDSAAMAAAGGKKKMLATLVGCTYAGMEFEMQSSINDVHAMRAVLLARFGFAPDNITVLTEDDPEMLPTGAAIKGALDDMVKRAAPGDVLFFYFSGGGIGSASADGPGGCVDQLIVPCDFHITGREMEEKFITDLYFRKLVDRVPAGATFTMVADSPQSGGLIDQEKEQIGPAAAAAADHQLHARARASRSLPYAVVLGHLSAASGLGASPHIDDASAMFHASVNADAGILLSACQKDQSTKEVQGDDGKMYGAFTRSLLAVLTADPAPMSNREVVRRAREELSKQGIPQHPCLYCSDANADAPFLGQQDTKAKGN